MNDLIINSIVLTGTIFLILVVSFFIKRKEFILNYNSIIQKVNKLDTKSAEKGIFSDFFDYMITIIFVGVSILFLLWIEYHTSPKVVYIISVSSILAFYFLNRATVNENKKGAILLLALVLAFFLLLLTDKQNLLAISLSGLIIGIGFSMKLKDVKIKEFIAPILEKGLKSIHLFELFSTVKKVAAQLSSSKVFKRELQNTQALIIALAILLFVIFPKISHLFTENIIDSINSFTEYFSQNKNHIPVFVFFGYIILSITHTLDYVNSFYKNEKKQLGTGIYNTLVFIITLSMILPYTFIALILFGFIVGIGYYIFGIDFAIILGFFVFPNWISKLHSYQIAIFVLAIPDLKVLKNKK